MLLSSRVNVILGSFLDVETVIVAHDTFKSVGVSSFVLENCFPMSVDVVSDYLLNVSVREIERIVTDVVLIGTLPRIENPLFNLKMRKSYLSYGTRYFSVGNVVYTSFPVVSLGVTTASLFKVIEGSHSYARLVYSAQIFPYILVGPSVLTLEGVGGILNAIKTFSSQLAVYSSATMRRVRSMLEYKTNLYFGTLQYNVSRLAVFDVGVKLSSMCVDNSAQIFYYMLKSDDVEILTSNKQFVCYQGSHGDKAALIADIVLPASTGVETTSIFVNMEGIYQLSKQCVSGLSTVNSNVVVLDMLKSEFMRLNVFAFIRSYKTLVSGLCAGFLNMSVASRLNLFVNNRIQVVSSKNFAKFVSNYYIISNVILNVVSLSYYNQNSISRASRVLSSAAKLELSRMTMLKI